MFFVEGIVNGGEGSKHGRGAKLRRLKTAVARKSSACGFMFVAQYPHTRIAEPLIQSIQRALTDCLPITNESVAIAPTCIAIDEPWALSIVEKNEPRNASALLTCHADSRLTNCLLTGHAG